METKQVKSWAELIEIFENSRKSDVIYRGVTNENYELLPKVGRPEIFKTGWSKDAEKHILTQFKRLARPHLVRQPDEKNESDWLVIGQHHGLPTRLLDWTEKPMTATFFSVELRGGEKDEQNTAIYIERQQRSAWTSVANIFEIEELEFLYPPHITKRITSQNGIFTVHPKPAVPHDSETLEKIIIPYDLRKEIQEALDDYGVNRASLFPDLDGITAFLEWKFKNRLNRHNDD